MNQAKFAAMSDSTSTTDFVIAAAIAGALIVLGTLVFNFILRGLVRYLRRHEHRHYINMPASMLAIFVCHTVAVWMYGIAFWLMGERFGFGALYGEVGPRDFFTYLYFSATTYSSLGFGEITPVGPMRFLTGVEAINGLILIGWSVTYTYFATERFLGLDRGDRQSGGG